jgi:hypothetical protein
VPNRILPQHENEDAVARNEVFDEAFIGSQNLLHVGRLYSRETKQLRASGVSGAGAFHDLGVFSLRLRNSRSDTGNLTIIEIAL